MWLSIWFNFIIWWYFLELLFFSFFLFLDCFSWIVKLSFLKLFLLFFYNISLLIILPLISFFIFIGLLLLNFLWLWFFCFLLRNLIILTKIVAITSFGHYRTIFHLIHWTSSIKWTFILHNRTSTYRILWSNWFLLEVGIATDFSILGIISHFSDSFRLYYFLFNLLQRDSFWFLFISSKIVFLKLLLFEVSLLFQRFYILLSFSPFRKGQGRLWFLHGYVWLKDPHAIII